MNRDSETLWGKICMLLYSVALDEHFYKCVSGETAHKDGALAFKEQISNAWGDQQISMVSARVCVKSIVALIAWSQPFFYVNCNL